MWMPANFGENDTFTISAWVYVNELDSNYHDIISKGNHQYGLQINKSDAWTLWEFRHQVGWDTTYCEASPGEWTHVTGVFSGEHQYLYINGTIIEGVFGTIPSSDYRNESFDVFIGRRSDVPSRYFHGILDEIRISNRARSESWIRLCFENQRRNQTLVSIHK
ncbi:MAG: LamG domain-containing protein [Chitinivibrionales bacterium]